MENISPRLMAYLKSWYATTTRNKAEAGATIELTFEQFVGLMEKRQLASLQKAIDNNSIRYQQDENNPYAYVATWQSYAACSTGIYSKDTACICSRMKSQKINLAGPGDTLRPSHVANISKSLTGKPKSEEHCENISAGKKGRPIASWTDERKAERRAQIAAKKAVQEANQIDRQRPTKETTMIEVRIPVPIEEYFETRDMLETSFNEHSIPVVMSADTVLRTWAGFKFHNWFENHETYVDHFIGWGELGVPWQEDVMLAAVGHEFLDEDHRPQIVMIFMDDDEDAAFTAHQRTLALMFKLAWGGTA